MICFWISLLIIRWKKIMSKMRKRDSTQDHFWVLKTTPRCLLIVRTTRCFLVESFWSSVQYGSWECLRGVVWAEVPKTGNGKKKKKGTPREEGWLISKTFPRGDPMIIAFRHFHLVWKPHLSTLFVMCIAPTMCCLSVIQWIIDQLD